MSFGRIEIYLRARNKFRQNCAICTVKIVHRFPKFYTMASCISSLCPAWERIVEVECEKKVFTCWWGCVPWQSHIGAPREPGPPFAILAGGGIIPSNSAKNLLSNMARFPLSNLAKKFWIVHLVEDVLLVGAVQLLDRGEKLVCSNSSHHLAVQEKYEMCCSFLKLF